ncbi:hypothetical protein C4573_02430 [Candidatus Woesearchaeota archaeon]|nr:MAG: hypothetical protein C4573_02430 [Candidatus Woesearchaeota archaeon]
MQGLKINKEETAMWGKKPTLEMLAKKYDALLLIHPDCIPPKTQYADNASFPYGYVEAVTKATTHFSAEGKPVFVQPLEWDREYFSQETTGLWIKLPLEATDFQHHVSTIADRIAKPADKISLAIGGLYWDRCVYGWASQICKNLSMPEPVRQRHPDIHRGNQGPLWIKKGTVISELTDYAYSEP